MTDQGLAMGMERQRGHRVHQEERNERGKTRLCRIRVSKTMYVFEDSVIANMFANT